MYEGWITNYITGELQDEKLEYLCIKNFTIKMQRVNLRELEDKNLGVKKLQNEQLD